MKKKLIAKMRSFVEKIWCIPLPLFIATPSPPLISFRLFFHPHTQPPPLPSLLSTGEYFTVEILSRKNKHQWLNKLCYHFDVLLKKVCQRKFKLGNSTKIHEYKSSRKIHRQPIRKIKSTRNVKKMTRKNKSTQKFLSLR